MKIGQMRSWKDFGLLSLDDQAELYGLFYGGYCLSKDLIQVDPPNDAMQRNHQVLVQMRMYTTLAANKIAEIEKHQEHLALQTDLLLEGIIGPEGFFNT